MNCFTFAAPTAASSAIQSDVAFSHTNCHGDRNAPFASAAPVKPDSSTGEPTLDAGTPVPIVKIPAHPTSTALSVPYSCPLKIPTQRAEIEPGPATYTGDTHADVTDAPNVIGK